MMLWAYILVPSALFGILCAYFLEGDSGTFIAGIIPWLGLLCYILYTHYFGGGVEMWQVAQFFGGGAVAVTGVLSYVLFREIFNGKT